MRVTIDVPLPYRICTSVISGQQANAPFSSPIERADGPEFPPPTSQHEEFAIEQIDRQIATAAVDKSRSDWRTKFRIPEEVAFDPKQTLVAVMDTLKKLEAAGSESGRPSEPRTSTR